MVGFCDSDYSGDIDKRRSLTRYCFTLFGNVLSWNATLQSVVVLSTTEAKFMALTEATKEAVWLKGLIEEFGVNQCTVPIFSDSQSAIHLTKIQGYHERTKHIDVRLFFIRAVISSKKVEVRKISTEENLADFLTKSVTSNKFQKCMSLLGVSDVDRE